MHAAALLDGFEDARRPSRTFRLVPKGGNTIFEGCTCAPPRPVSHPPPAAGATTCIAKQCYSSWTLSEGGGMLLSWKRSGASWPGLGAASNSILGKGGGEGLMTSVPDGGSGRAY